MTDQARPRKMLRLAGRAIAFSQRFEGLLSGVYRKVSCKLRFNKSTDALTPFFRFVLCSSGIPG
jgi:hypothetical protein